MQFHEISSFLEIPVFGTVTFCILGLLFGSFITAVSHRLPRKEDFINARSACPACHHTLGIADLVPVFSWIFSRGKCRYCKTVVSIRYPLIELGSALSFMGIYWGVGINLYTPLWIVGVVAVWVMGVVGVEKYHGKP
jgi:leader peptidase (prepilin peptidase)/N-methyltransferase